MNIIEYPLAGVDAEEERRMLQRFWDPNCLHDRFCAKVNYDEEVVMLWKYGNLFTSGHISKTTRYGRRPLLAREAFASDAQLATHQKEDFATLQKEYNTTYERKSY